MIYLKESEQQHNLQLNGRKLLLRPFTVEDIPTLHAALSKDLEHLIYWWLCGVNPENICLEIIGNLVNDYIKTWAAGTEYHYALIDIASSEIVGEFIIHDINHVNQHACIGYWMATNPIVKGNCHLFTAFLACRALVELNLNRIEFFIANKNIKSIKSIQKLPVLNEGLLRNRLKIQDHVYDTLVFSFIDADLYALQNICLPLRTN
jgi:RimJ/RimL family protein N-acetyltransferase